MKRTFIQAFEFSKKWDELGMSDDALRELECNIMENTALYPIMRGTGGLRKMRFAYGQNGKSGGIRVCFIDFTELETVYLVTVYSKSEKDNLSKAERNSIREMISRLKNCLQGGQNG